MDGECLNFGEVGNWCQCDELIVPRNDMTTKQKILAMKRIIRSKG
jgi:hypothetical protein